MSRAEESNGGKWEQLKLNNSKKNLKTKSRKKIPTLCYLIKMRQTEKRLITVN